MSALKDLKYETLKMAGRAVLRPIVREGTGQADIQKGAVETGEGCSVVRDASRTRSCH